MAGGNPALMLSERNFKKCKDKWVAVKSRRRINQVITSADNLEEIQVKIGGKGYFNAVIFFVENENQRAQ